MTDDDLCRRCGEPRVQPDRWTFRPIRGEIRGLCPYCYQRESRAGRLHTWPRLRPASGGPQAPHRWPAMAEDLADMAAAGETKHGAARRLGIKPGSVYRACLRAGRTDLWEALT